MSTHTEYVEDLNETNQEVKLEQHELAQFNQLYSATADVKNKIAENSIQEQQILADKPRLMFDFNKAVAEFQEFQKTLRAKYGDDFNVNLQTGAITYK